MGLLDVPGVSKTQADANYLLRSAPANVALISTMSRTVGTTAMALVFGNSIRRKVVVQNKGSADVQIVMASTVTAYGAPSFSSPMVIKANEQITICEPFPVWAKSTSGNQSLVVRQESGSY